MGWFDILKVEDIDFDGDIEGFGYYGMSGKPMDMGKVMELVMSGKAPELKDVMNEEIRINHKRIYQYLKDKLRREPTEREIQEFVVRAIMHESTHAGMGIDQLPMTPAQKEYGAFTGQFPDNIFYRLKSLIDHPATEVQYMHPMLASLVNTKGSVSSRPIEETKKFVAFVEVITDNLNVDNRTKDKIRDKLARLEVMARTEGKPFEDLDPSNELSWIRRYGGKHGDFLRKVWLASRMGNKTEFNDEELKMVGAVSTTSAPAMFNKVVRGRKKRRDEDARR